MVVTEEEVANAVYWKFRESQAKAIRGEGRVGWHVNDYVNECMRKAVYDRSGSSEGGMDAQQLSTFWIGQVVHGAVDLGGKDGLHEVGMAYDFVKGEIMEYKKEYADRPPEDILRGKFDDIVVLKDVRCIVDKKTYQQHGSWSIKKPYDHHILAINQYRLLINKCLGIDAEFGCSVYVDLSDKDNIKLIPMAYKLKPIEETLAGLLLKNKRVKMGKEAYEKEVKASGGDKTGIMVGDFTERYKSWWCDGYCPHLVRCALAGEASGHK